MALAFAMGFGLTSCAYLAPLMPVNRLFSNRSGFYRIIMAFTGAGGMLRATVGGAPICGRRRACRKCWIASRRSMSGACSRGSTAGGTIIAKMR